MTANPSPVQFTATQPSVSAPANSNPSQINVNIAQRPQWAQNRARQAKPPFMSQMMVWLGLTSTVLWLAAAAVVIYFEGRVQSLSFLQMGTLFTGAFAPPAMIWAMIAYVQRSQDIKAYLRPFMRQLDQLVYPSANAEMRVKAIGDALRAQASELVNATMQAEKSLQNARGLLQQDAEKINTVAAQAGNQFERTSSTLTERAARISQLSQALNTNLQGSERSMMASAEQFERMVDKAVEKTQHSTEQFGLQMEGTLRQMGDWHNDVANTTIAFDEKLQNVMRNSDITVERIGQAIQWLDERQDVAERVSGRIDTRMKQLNDVFARQIMDMRQVVLDFGDVGSSLTRTTTGFKLDAERTVEEAALYVGQLSSTLDMKLAETQAMIDDVNDQLSYSMNDFNQNLLGQLALLQNQLQRTANATPHLVETILDHTTKKLQQFEYQFSQSAVTSADYVQKVYGQLERRLGVFENMVGQVGENMGTQMQTAMDGAVAQLESVRNNFIAAGAQTNRDLDGFHTELAMTLEALAEVAKRSTDRTVNRLMTMSGMVGENIMRLQDVASRAAQTSAMVENRVYHQTQTFGMMADQLAARSAELDYKTDHYLGQLDMATQQVLDRADVFSTRMAHEMESLQQNTHGLVRDIHGATTDLSASQSHTYLALSSALYELRELQAQMDYQRDRFLAATSGAAQLANRFDQQNDYWLDQADQLDTRLATMATKADALVHAGRSLQNTLRLTNGDMLATAYKVSAETSAMSTALNDQVKEMTTQTAALVDTAQYATILFAEQRDVMDRANAQAQQLGHSLGIQHETLVNYAEAAEQVMSEAGKNFAAKAAEIGHVAMTAEQAIQHYGVRLVNENDRLQDIASQIDKGAALAMSQMASLNLQAQNQSMQSLAVLDDVGQQVNNRLNQLGENAKAISHELNYVGAAAQDQLHQLGNSAAAALVQVAALDDTARSQQTQIQTTQMQMAMLGEVVHEQAAMLAELSRTTQDVLGRSNQETATLSSDVSQMVARHMQTIASHMEQLQHQMQALDSLAQQASQSTAVWQDQTLETAAIAKTVESQLQEKIATFADMNGQAQQALGQAMAELARQTHQVDVSVRDNATLLMKTTAAWQHSMAQLQASAANTEVQGQSLLNAFAAQIKRMDDVAALAEKRTGEVQNSEIRARRDSFLNAAKFITETLHSLSIDMTRIFDPAVADRLWKMGGKNDPAAFTRKLVAMKDAQPLEKLRAQFEQNNELRTYVQRYFRQFEELCTHARAVDHGDLLTATLMTSDIGKLYQFLAAALNHDGLKTKTKGGSVAA